jgi:integrase
MGLYVKGVFMGRCSAISKDDQSRVEAWLSKTSQPARNVCLFVLGVETGLRISELLSIRVSDVIDVCGRVKQVLKIKKSFVKGKKSGRDITLSPSARDAVFKAVTELSDYHKSRSSEFLFSPTYRTGAITRRQAYCIISQAIRSAGITHTKGTHTMRKTCAERTAMCALRKYYDKQTTTLPTVAVMRALGHANLQTTERYLAKGSEEVNQWRANGEI